MTSPLNWNDPKTTWKLASYEPPVERRRAVDDRRSTSMRAAMGERREKNRRILASLRRL